MYHDTVAYDACLVFRVYLAVDDKTAGNGADLRNLEYLLYLYLAGDNFFLHLVEHTLHGGLDVVDSVVDDRVGVDLDSLALSKFAGV